MANLRILAHAGAGSSPDHRDATERAVDAAFAAALEGRDLLDAVCHTCALLEDDPRLNAGTGSNFRLDGKTIEMDASVMDSDGRFGAVGAIRRVRNPVWVARAVMETPHNLLVGDGATRFARTHGHAEYDPATQDARAKYDRFVSRLGSDNDPLASWGWDRPRLRANWNFDVAAHDVLGTTDTVGVVATDGTRCVGALSTGGGIGQLIGRIGDVPLPGCGLQVGPAGAVAATGDGEDITRVRLADRVYHWLEQGITAEVAAQRALDLFPIEVDVGLIVVTPRGGAAASNRQMAWSRRER